MKAGGREFNLPKVSAPLLLVGPSRQLVGPMHQEVERQDGELELLVEEAEHVLRQESDARIALHNVTWALSLP